MHDVLSFMSLVYKASKTKSWLWHQRLSHLNFGAINHLARHGLVRGLPKLKFKKDHLCSACVMEKLERNPTNLNSEDDNQEKTLSFAQGSCGPMHVAIVNGRSTSSSLSMITLDLHGFMQMLRYSYGQKQLLPLVTPKIVPSYVFVMDLLFQPLFDELLTPPPNVDHPTPEVIAPIAEVVAPELAVLNGSPSSTIIDQNAPSPSNSQITPKTKSHILPNDVEEENHGLDVAHMNNDPFFGILIPENNYEASSSSDVIPTVV
ncbi:retrovirus-related pol polyprotein from transposon TNT 1-94 [Tanacetum coccineum]